MPSRAKLALKRDSGLATRKSADSATPRPPPTAAPWTAATTGLRAANSLTACSYRSPSAGFFVRALVVFGDRTDQRPVEVVVGRAAELHHCHSVGTTLDRDLFAHSS